MLRLGVLGLPFVRVSGRAMNGVLKFEDAFHERLQLIKPTVRSFAEMEERHPATLSPGVERLVHTLHRKGKHVYFVSGGMKQVGDEERCRRARARTVGVCVCPCAHVCVCWRMKVACSRGSVF